MYYLKTIGIIGGGQLGKMIAIAAAKLGYRTYIFANSKDDPACCITDNVTIAQFSDDDALETFTKSVDFVTIDSENVPCHEILSQIDFCPGRTALYVSQNRLREKDFIKNLDIKTVYYTSIKNYDELLEKSKTFSFPMRLKTTEMGYDGKGQYLITSIDQIHSLNSILSWNTEYILESSVELLKEVSIVVARDREHKIEFFPVAENYHINGILYTSTVPAQIDSNLAEQIQRTATKIVHALDIVGILAIEFFVTKNKELLVNEIAPRPHNSCHWSLDACNISQFEQLVRIICGLPMQEVVLRYPCMTKNIIGNDIRNAHKYLNHKKANLTIYGKKEARDNRKMGHVNIML
ncbi:5-(carboxyamino)imidazole ribonucleotide synthase [Wolbachia pipientis]|uniref:N5-carboxyaminoimidazole ribonucleotide synthase n=1 Tax=Wolbachia pipientis TaxID=955 RepID=A0A1E7QK92_WOLPI|nr:5-(carboxyamino)imidazole ribonucleotide synthase [Wolbachia pipientis]OEY86891.1 5-(carboxyamino)imidazole ribonucleotide synthase [Wolbachia pipientis]